MISNPQLAISILTLIIFLTIGIFAPFLTPYSYWESDWASSLKAPSLKHLFGTDQQGRDIFTRAIFATRPALIIAFGVAIIAGLIGISAGILAGYFGGSVDRIFSGLMDLTWSFPTILLAIALVVIMEPGLQSIIVAITATWWSQYARVIRGQVLSTKEEEYIEASKALGAGHLRIIWKDIIPNTIPAVIVLVTTTMGYAVIVAAMLSFLGIGVQPPTPSWGVMLSNNRGFISQAPWTCIFPGLMIAVFVLSLNLLGDSLRDILDPYIQGSGIL